MLLLLLVHRLGGSLGSLGGELCDPLHARAHRVQQVRPLPLLPVASHPMHKLGVRGGGKRPLEDGPELRQEREAEVPRARRPEPAEEIRRLGLIRQVHHRERRARHPRELLHQRRLTRSRLTHEQHRLRHLNRRGDALQDSHRVTRLGPPPVRTVRRGDAVAGGEHRPANRDPARAPLHGGLVEDVGVLRGVGAEAPAPRHGLEHPSLANPRGKHPAQDVRRLLVRGEPHLRRQRIRPRLAQSDERQLRLSHPFEAPGPSE
mmetsp:Transcript_12833/g.50164  ORF Transcript_12833/g.50164 Transcript_12833/m.50164 type:complete len:261 (+) Transcript_12833:7232-8014(+)